MFAGAVVNLITKSGSNEFHGELFDFFRNEEANARKLFQHVPGEAKQPFKRPVRRKRNRSAGEGQAVLSVNYEGVRQHITTLR